MKSSHLLPAGCFVALLFFFELPHAYGQRAPFEGANTIFVTTSLADRQTYEAIEKVLVEQGVLFSATSDGLLLSSQESQFGNYKGAKFIGQLSVRGGLIRLTGQMQAPATEDRPSSDVMVVAAAYQPTKRKESLQRLGFLYLNELAKKLQIALHGVVSYKVQG